MLYIVKEYGFTTLMLPILLNLEISSLSLVKAVGIRKIIFYFLYNCIIRVVINLTSFNVLPAHLNSSPLHEGVFKHIILLSSRELCLRFESAQWKSSDVFVADRLRVLSNFQFLMKFHSFDDILHCFSRSLLWSNRLGSSLIGIRE